MSAICDIGRRSVVDFWRLHARKEMVRYNHFDTCRLTADFSSRINLGRSLFHQKAGLLLARLAPAEYLRASDSGGWLPSSFAAGVGELGRIRLFSRGRRLCCLPPSRWIRKHTRLGIPAGDVAIGRLDQTKGCHSWCWPRGTGIGTQDNRSPRNINGGCRLAVSCRGRSAQRACRGGRKFNLTPKYEPCEPSASEQCPGAHHRRTGAARARNRKTDRPVSGERHANSRCPAAL